jgi:hypothetical protein
MVLSLALTVSVPAVAETVIAVDLKSGTTVSRQTLYLAADGFRMEGPSTVTIFRPDQNELYDVTLARQRYTRVTPEKLRQAASDFDAARRDWSEKLRAMRDERRKRMEAAFGPATASSKSPLVFVPTELTATFDNRHCQMLHVMLEGVQHGSVCVVSLAELGLNASDVQVLRRLTEFMLQGPRPAVGLASFWDLAAIEAAVGHPAFPISAIIAVPSGWFEYTIRSVEKRASIATTAPVKSLSRRQSSTN